mmetsp:Transcript_32266/g.75769  ORF Transcript_32266/g.75769 Transcript_32266/m.75769 type:complete len:113 (+) Transcript_32266:774-1112(+)
MCVPPRFSLPYLLLVLLTSSERDVVVCSLVGLLFPIAYDVRTTLGEATCESGWTIATLSPLLSWFDVRLPPPLPMNIPPAGRNDQRHVGRVLPSRHCVPAVPQLGTRASSAP